MNKLFLHYLKYYSTRIKRIKNENHLEKSDLKSDLSKPYPTVSVVIPAYNGEKELEELIPLLKNQKVINPEKIIIVDSSSGDETKDAAIKLGAEVYKITKEEFSHSKARNIGASKVTSDYILFMTQDARPKGDDWLYNFVASIKADGAVAGSCAQTPRKDCDLFGRACIYGHANYLKQKNNSDMNRQYNAHELRKKAHLDDVACMVEKEVFDKFLYRGEYAEDLDLGVRLLNAGYNITFISSCQVIHSHNRDSLYYFNRELVDRRSLERIIPGMIESYEDGQTIADKIITGYVVCSKLIEYITNNNELDISKLRLKLIRDYYSILRSAKDLLANRLRVEKNEYFDDEIFFIINVIINHLRRIQFNYGLVGYTYDFIVFDVLGCLLSDKKILNQDDKAEIIKCIAKRFSQSMGFAMAAFDGAEDSMISTSLKVYIENAIQHV